MDIVSLLARPLAADEHRAEFWHRHVRLGVVLSQLAGLVVGCYAVLAERPHAVMLTVLAAAVVLGSPALLLVPMRRLCRDRRGALVFYAWSGTTTAMICLAIVIDGGASSTLCWMLTLTLTYAGLAYPPLGVLVMGSAMVGGYLGAAATHPGSPAQTSVTACVLALFTAMIAWSSRNQWDMADQQSRLTEHLATLADTDSLTGCLNRRAFHARLDVELGRVGPRYPVSLCLLDLDGFKQVNDTYGHAAGDAILAETAAALLGSARAGDAVGRLGGDEFAVLLPGMEPAAAAAAGVRLQQQLRDALAASTGLAAGVTASIGIATATRRLAAQSLLASADRLMYEAKTGGRDQIQQRGYAADAH